MCEKGHVIQMHRFEKRGTHLRGRVEPVERRAMECVLCYTILKALKKRWGKKDV
ncbi:MAG: hypothetical protein ABSC19_17645 [Syntrophorhabdales bacterium]|jgi:hypothetical protein